MVRCSKCGNRVCKGKAMYYNAPLNQLCNSCREKALEEIKITPTGLVHDGEPTE